MELYRPAEERGHAKFDWLDSHHTFSFGHYYDPKHMGFDSLRVINDDTVAPKGGFAPHGHENMEIISVVLDGVLEHQDSIGNGSQIKAGDVQRMSAGTGIRHSEFNGSATDAVHFLQIWIEPDAEGYEPGYEQKYFDRADRVDQWQLLVSPDGTDGSLRINQQAKLHAAVLSDGHTLTFTADGNRNLWLQVVSGHLTVNGRELKEADGLGLSAGSVSISSDGESEVLLFELGESS
ncbi:MAG: pirin family protein [Pseudomonadota bacterium]